MGKIRIGEKVHQQVLHAAQEPRHLEDRLIEFAGHRVAARLVIRHLGGERLEPIVRIDVGPVEVQHLFRRLARGERVIFELDEMFDRAGHHADAPLVEDHVVRDGIRIEPAEVRLLAGGGEVHRAGVKVEVFAWLKVGSGALTIDLIKPGVNAPQLISNGQRSGMVVLRMAASTRWRGVMGSVVVVINSVVVKTCTGPSRPDGSNGDWAL